MVRRYITLLSIEFVISIKRELNNYYYRKIYKFIKYCNVFVPRYVYNLYPNIIQIYTFII